MKPRKQRLHSAELRRLDHIATALDRIATAIENTPPTEIGRINNRFNIGDGVGLQVALNNISNATEVDSGNNDTSQVVEGNGNNSNDNHSSVSGDTKHIQGVAKSFNTNANDVVKDLTEALHRSTAQRSEQQKKINEL